MRPTDDESMMSIPPPAELVGRNLGDVVTVRTANPSRRDELNEEALRHGVDLVEVQIRATERSVRAVLLVPGEDTTVNTAVLYLHGGGYFSGDAYSFLDEPLDWVANTGIVVLSVDYRLAPEHPYPAGLEDAYVALRWFREYARSRGIDRVLWVWGQRWRRPDRRARAVRSRS